MDSDARAAAWTFLAVLLGFKTGVALLIFLLQPSGASAVFLLAMQWYWLVPPLILLAPLLLFRFRLARARARRRALIRAEWEVESTSPEWNPTSAPGTM
jgi:hypothetical protein